MSVKDLNSACISVAVIMETYLMCTSKEVLESMDLCLQTHLTLLRECFSRADRNQNATTKNAPPNSCRSFDLSVDCYVYVGG